MKKIGKILTICLFYSFFMLSNLSTSLALEGEEILPNKNITKRLMPGKTSVSYRVKIKDSGYQYFKFYYNENPGNKLGKGFTVTLRDENGKLLYQEDEIYDSHISDKFSLVKGSEVFVLISENFEYLDEVNGADIKFNFVSVKTKYTEIESNDSQTMANKIYNGHGSRGNLYVASDIDYFKYKVPNNGKTTINLKISEPYLYSGSIGKGLKMTIMNSSGTILYNKGDITDYKFSYDLKFGKGETLFIMVSATDTASFPQGIDYILTSTTRGDKYSESENNDAFSNANSITSKKNGVVDGGEDKDYFVYKAKKTKEYRIKLKSTSKKNKLTLSVFKNTSGKAVIEKIISNKGEVKLNLKKGSKIWIRISGKNESNTIADQYSLSIK